MAYATIQDMIDRFGQQELCDATSTLDRERGSMDVERINRALEESSAVADSYLQRRYALPIRPRQLSLVRAVCALARYELYQGEAVDPSDKIRIGRKDALQWLADIGAGRATLDVTAVNDSSNTWSRVAARPCSIRANKLW